MKSAETVSQNNFNLETCVSIRVVQEVFGCFNNEQQKFQRHLLDLVKVAASSYKEIVSQNAAMKRRKWEHAEQLREELLVFKRYTPKQLNAKIGEGGKDIAFMGSQLQEVKQKKIKLQDEKDAQALLKDLQFSAIIDNFCLTWFLI